MHTYKYRLEIYSYDLLLNVFIPCMLHACSPHVFGAPSYVLGLEQMARRHMGSAPTIRTPRNLSDFTSRWDDVSASILLTNRFRRALRTMFLPVSFTIGARACF